MDRNGMGYFNRKRLAYAIITALQTGPKSSREIAMALREIKHQGYSFWVNGEIDHVIRRLIGEQAIFIISPDGERPIIYSLTSRKAA